MADYQRARHSVTALHVHMVFVTKYRRRVFTAPILTRCEHIMRTICAELGATLDEFNGEPDHVHLLITYPPTLAISTLAMRLKGRTAHTIRSENRLHISTLRMNGHLWSPAYFAASAGGAPLATIKQYIEIQERPTQ
ncbi:IS200/IS605 family transposase [Microbacterium maritypicum]|uniref:IS200/IS605 family transposase n=1 Tax=Microbacterium maritypicum TaxID=33918 RepID=UPI0038206B7D